MAVITYSYRLRDVEIINCVWITKKSQFFFTISHLQDNGYGPSINEDDSSKLDLEDYRPIDPVPSSKASVKPGPIEHGTPLMPYIPKPSPPPISTIDGLP